MIILQNISNKTSKIYLRNLRKGFKIGQILYRLLERRKVMQNLKDLKKMKKKEEKLIEKNTSTRWLKSKELSRKPISSYTIKMIK